MTVMKKSVSIACVLFTAGIGLAQEVNYSIAKQQARRDSAQNDAEQQRIAREANGPGGASAAPGAAAASAAPVDPALQATLSNVAGLKSDFAAVISSTGDKPDPAQKDSLLNNLSQAAQGAKKASANSVKKLADDLLTAVAGNKKLAVAQQTKLAREVHALFNSAHLSAAQQQSLFTDVQKILTDGGATLDDAVNVVTDLKAVADETK
jgi:hypothetical protein